jgi:large subunit ribosomal protein L47
MHCSSRCIFGGLVSATTQRSTTLPPGFLIPAFSSASQTASFSSSTARHARKDGNPARGISAIRRTGLNKKIKLSVDLKDLPKPVLDPARRSSVEVDDDHGLWGFFNKARDPLMTPEDLHAHGRAWTTQELRSKSWDDLHRLWWLCVKDINRVMTYEAERIRTEAGYGEYEAQARLKEVCVVAHGTDKIGH